MKLTSDREIYALKGKVSIVRMSTVSHSCRLATKDQQFTELTQRLDLQCAEIQEVRHVATRAVQIAVGKFEASVAQQVSDALLLLQHATDECNKLNSRAAYNVRIEGLEYKVKSLTREVESLRELFTDRCTRPPVGEASRAPKRVHPQSHVQPPEGRGRDQTDTDTQSRPNWVRTDGHFYAHIQYGV